MAQSSMMPLPAAMDWSGEVRGAEPGWGRETGGTGGYYHISYDQLRPDGTGEQGNMSLDMTNPLTQEEMANPMSNSEVYHGSLKNLLSRNVGHYVVATFQLGGQGTVSVPGILYTVGNDYIVLYQPADGRYVTGDLYALKFVDFHDAASVPEAYRIR